MATRATRSDPTNEAVLAEPPARPAKGKRAPELRTVAAPPATSAPAAAVARELAEHRAFLEVRKLEIETERADLELEILRRRESDAASEADRSRHYTFYSDVTAESVRQCMADLGQWARRDPGHPITVTFNSPGGSVLDGLALFDFFRQLRKQGHHLTTVAIGRAASMGAVLLQAGDVRLVGQNAFLLVHEVTHLSAGKVSELEDSVEFSRRLQQRLLAILAERSSLGPRDIQRRWARKEWWLDATEAVELGLADDVL